MMGLVRQQAAVLSYADLFLMLTVLFVILAGTAILMKRPPAAAASAGGH
jgi:DHA2 family multidrug resistance protein